MLGSNENKHFLFNSPNRQRSIVIRIKGPPHYKMGLAKELEWRGYDGKIHPVYHSWRSYLIGLGVRAFVKIGNKWYELDENEKRTRILW